MIEKAKIKKTVCFVLSVMLIAAMCILIKIREDKEAVAVFGQGATERQNTTFEDVLGELM